MQPCRRLESASRRCQVGRGNATYDRILDRWARRMRGRLRMLLRKTASSRAAAGASMRSAQWAGAYMPLQLWAFVSHVFAVQQSGSPTADGRRPARATSGPTSWTRKCAVVCLDTQSVGMWLLAGLPQSPRDDVRSAVQGRHGLRTWLAGAVRCPGSLSPCQRAFAADDAQPSGCHSGSPSPCEAGQECIGMKERTTARPSPPRRLLCLRHAGCDSSN